MHEHVSSNTQWDSIQQRWQSVLQKMSIAYWVYEATHIGLLNSPQQQPKHWEPL
jgi:hypothetical protein